MLGNHKIRCLFCGKRFDNYDQFKKHLSDSEICSDSVKKINEKSIEELPNPSRTEKRYICDNCNYYGGFIRSMDKNIFCPNCRNDLNKGKKNV